METLVFRGTVATFLFFCIGLTVFSGHKSEQDFRVADTAQGHDTESRCKGLPKSGGETEAEATEVIFLSKHVSEPRTNLDLWHPGCSLIHLSMLSFISCPSMLIATKSQRSHYT